MNLKELENLDHPALLVTNLPIFQPLMSYGPHEGAIPMGTMITITGEPGTGKTKYALQLLDNIGKFNEVETVYNGFEQAPALLKGYIHSLGINSIDDFNFDGDRLAIRPGQVHVIDTIDAYASLHYGKDYPDAKLAAWMQGVLENNCVVINVHHKTATGRKESGSSKFNQMTTAVIELRKSGNSVMVNTKRKNRYPGTVNSLELMHTETGLVLAPTFTEKLAGWMQNFKAKRR